MKIKIKILWVCVLAATVFLAGCKKDQYTVIDNAMYISEANQAPSKKLIIDEEAIPVQITPRMVQKASQSVTAKVVVDTAALSLHNRQNGTNYIPLPDSMFTLSSDVVTIPAGSVSAAPVTAMVKPFTKEMKTGGDNYALPLALQNVSGSTPIVSMKSFVYEFQPVIYTAVPVFKSSNAPVVKFRQSYSLMAWSIEMRVNMSLLGTANGQLNNQALMSVGPTEIYIRFGDAPIPGNLLQVKHQGTQINSNAKFAANTWYHLAFVSDGNNLKIYVNGVLDGTLSLPGSVTNITDMTMISSGSYFRADCMMNEVRFWTRAISQNQIVNNMYGVNSKTPGLEAYWKMNEGKGNVLEDATGHGNTATAKTPVTWQANVRMPAK